MKILLISILLATALTSFSQRLKLTKSTTSKVLYLTQGDRVRFLFGTYAQKALYPQVKYSIGKIEKIAADSVTIKGNRIAIADIGGIGRRRSGSGFAVYALTFVGTGLVVSAINSGKNDPCPSCQTAPGSDDGSSSNTIAVIGGLGFITLSINTIVRNSEHYMKNWKLEVVD